jgi:serine/threonine protein kinase
MAIPEGTKLGRYEIRSILGSGGMGEVYLADDLTLHRKVAIKVLRADVIGNKDRLQRFELEAFAASSLNHPNILTIYEIGHENEYHFMVTEFIDGESLGQRLKRQSMKLAESIELGIQVASALAAAHAAGIAHRDIKPDNIMLRRDHLVKVLDFGLAKLSEPELADPELLTKVLQVTMPGVVMGTARYMSPEQARGLPVDVRTDIWSLGVVLYRMVAGNLPFGGNTMSDVIVAILTTEPPALTTYGLDVPAELDRIVTKTLRKDREELRKRIARLVEVLEGLE